MSQEQPSGYDTQGHVVAAVFRVPLPKRQKKQAYCSFVRTKRRRRKDPARGDGLKAGAGDDSSHGIPQV
ncbi:hypothetical protein KIPB_013623 [Kipferlia bialata]|uniref:Uncharacterized protein n=1 Tax=Kipferlia bialata TaxID=797122 RepID=A0A9K3D992_9EUKA|nr:hypothetical protein KIPB_013623 [Kipferlia bialata]|eukprot:g13623.t1